MFLLLPSFPSSTRRCNRMVMHSTRSSTREYISKAARQRQQSCKLQLQYKSQHATKGELNSSCCYTTTTTTTIQRKKEKAKLKRLEAEQILSHSFPLSLTTTSPRHTAVSPLFLCVILSNTFFSLNKPQIDRYTSKPDFDYYYTFFLFARLILLRAHPSPS